MCLQNFSGSGYSGLVYDSPEEIRDYSVKGKWRIPINMHIGNMGLAPVTGAPISTAPPLRSGGNIDNKRIGIGGVQTTLPSSFPGGGRGGGGGGAAGGGGGGGGGRRPRPRARPPPPPPAAGGG